MTDAGNPCDVYLPGGEYYDNTCFLPAAKPMTLQDATVTYFYFLLCHRVHWHLSLCFDRKEFRKWNYVREKGRKIYDCPKFIASYFTPGIISLLKDSVR